MSAFANSQSNGNGPVDKWLLPARFQPRNVGFSSESQPAADFAEAADPGFKFPSRETVRKGLGLGVDVSVYKYF